MTLNALLHSFLSESENVQKEIFLHKIYAPLQLRKVRGVLCATQYFSANETCLVTTLLFFFSKPKCPSEPNRTSVHSTLCKGIYWYTRGWRDG